MKKILLSVVLGVTVVAMGETNPAPLAPGQSATPSATGQAAAPAQQPAPSQAPVIKDPAEYNAYVAAVQQKDANAKISGLEAFVTQYPNSVMKNQALEILLGTYQQTGNVKKALETAAKLVAVQPCSVPALFLLTYVNRVTAQSGDANGKQESADAEKYGQQGLDCLPKYQKPEGTSDADFQKQVATMKENFNAGIGWGALQEKNNAKAAQFLKAALDSNPPDSQKDLALLYPLALSYLQQTPPDYQNGVWFAARAAAVAPAASQPGLEKYARSQYMHYHQGDDGWDNVLNAAKAGGPQVPIPPPPTPADQAHDMVAKTPPDKMDFATWEFVLSNGSQADQDTVWNAIKGKAVQMNGTVISTEPEQFMIAGSSDDIDAKKADITLKFEEKVPVKMIPKDGASFDFQGEPASYTPNPFMMVMEKGQLLRAKPAAPAHKTTTHKKPAAQ
ncbi:MAG: hypothetical protein WCF26_03300 [Candidatus Sulfotelmatobacter sp.]